MTTQVDLERLAREAGKAGASYAEWTSTDEAFEAIRAADDAGVRIDARAIEAAYREGRREHRLTGGWRSLWTTAPADYDQFGTETVEGPLDWDRKQLRRVVVDPVHYGYQTARYASGLHGSWEEDPRELERRWAEERAREKAEQEEREARRKAGLEWLASAPDELVGADVDAFDEALRANGLRWEDGRDERRRRAAAREDAERAKKWARCRAAFEDGATLVDGGTEGYSGYYGWVRGRDPDAWRSVEVRVDYRGEDAERAQVYGEGGRLVGSLADVANHLATGRFRVAAPEERIPPRAVIERVGKPYTEILACSGGAWVGEPTFGDPLVLDDAGHLVRKKAVREEALREWRARRFGS
jgi:hypothetical protein